MRADDRRCSALQADCHQAEAQVCPRLGGCLLSFLSSCRNFGNADLVFKLPPYLYFRPHGKPHMVSGLFDVDDNRALDETEFAAFVTAFIYGLGAAFGLRHKDDIMPSMRSIRPLGRPPRRSQTIPKVGIFCHIISAVLQVCDAQNSFPLVSEASELPRSDCRMDVYIICVCVCAFFHAFFDFVHIAWHLKMSATNALLLKGHTDREKQ